MSSASPIDAVLSRLEKVRQRQAGQYSARCPAHADKGPSLSVRETQEGSVLLHCFAGCSVHEITAAMGLDMSDLFLPQQRTGREPKRLARVIAPSQALEVLVAEVMFVFVVASDMHHAKTIAPETFERLKQAAARVLEIHDLAKASL
jgi:hypothetical protein